jgi:hypothetical protein
VVGWQRHLVSIQTQSVIVILFWVFLIIVGAMLLYAGILLNFNLIMGCTGAGLAIFSTVFCAGTLYICTRNDHHYYGDVSDLR